MSTTPARMHCRVVSTLTRRVPPHENLGPQTDAYSMYADHDDRWRTFAKRLRDAGKPGSVVAAAVGNRWMRWLYHRLIEHAPSAHSAA